MRILCALLCIVGLCHGVSNASQCTSVGRFPNNEAENCRGYTICLIGGINNFTQYKLTCPDGFLYSHLEQQCTNTTEYKCFDSYNCTEVGDFPEPKTTDCRTFVSCIEVVSGAVSARLVDCPRDTLFDDSKGKCVNATDFNCNHRPTIFNVTQFVNASVIVYDFSTNTNSIQNSANLCKQMMSVFWLLIIFMM